MVKKKITLLQRCLLHKPVPIRTPDRPGRNQKCPCGSGGKFKKCCKTISVLVDRLKERIANGETPDVKR